MIIWVELAVRANLVCSCELTVGLELDFIVKMDDEGVLVFVVLIIVVFEMISGTELPLEV